MIEDYKQSIKVFKWAGDRAYTHSPSIVRKIYNKWFYLKYTTSNKVDIIFILEKYTNLCKK